MFTRRRLYAIAAVLIGVIVASFGIPWARYQESPIIGQSVLHVADDKTETPSTPQRVTTKHMAAWFHRWTTEHSSFFIAPSFQLSNGSLNSISELSPPINPDGSQVFHLDVTLRPRFSAVEQFSKNTDYLLRKDNDGALHGDWVIYLNRDKNVHVITDMMLPARYDIMTNPELLADPIPAEKLPDTTVANTYRIADNTLSVSYDFGKTWTEVPGAYDAVTRTTNGSHSTSLTRGSYVISPDFTGFISFNEDKASLIFSTNSGATWATTDISSGYSAPCFLSYTEGNVIATFAQERTGGSDYYVSWRSDATTKYSRWVSQPLFRDFPPHLSLATWLSADNGFIGYAGEEPTIYVTSDRGITYQNVALDTVLPGYSTPEIFYIDDAIYAIIGQGLDGDDSIDGIMQEAVYRYDEESHMLTFVRKQDAPTPIDAG
ncbi:hypothetical protein [Arcanobacterium phocae]|uniref:hypothetical protein n=1 Tax=Arcanobacterium phocae TaxID=131112 RepID=UPI001C0F0CC9|nr:hypothetical protein [Arcanobacterium phocae]